MPRLLRSSLIALLVVAAGAAGAAALALARAPRGVWTDHDAIRIDAATIAPRRALWTPATLLREDGTAALATSADEYEPRLSPDGTQLVFVRKRPGEGADLFSARWTPEGWSQATPIASINSDADELGPAFSTDGRTLYFSSDRDGGFGGYDLWHARLESGDGEPDRWSTPTNLGPAVNTPFNEYGPAPGAERLYFASNRPRPDEAPQAAGADAWRATIRERRTRHDYDLFVAAIADGAPRDAEPLPINTPFDEGTPALSPAGDFLWFASDRPGGLGGYDLYRCRLRNGDPGIVERLEEAINSPHDELDPALAAEGFRICFSSNRPYGRAGDGARDGAPVHDYDLWTSVSREVEIETEPWPSMASLLERLWPWLLSLLALLALLLLLLHLLRDAAWRERFARLSLLAQCLILSLAAHALLAFLLALWHVGLGIGELLHGSSSTRVILAGTSSGSVADQVLASPVALDTLADMADLTPPPLLPSATQTIPDAASALPPLANGMLAGALAASPLPPEMQDRNAAVPSVSEPAPPTVVERSLASSAAAPIAPASSAQTQSKATLPPAADAASTLALDPTRLVAVAVASPVGADLSVPTAGAPPRIVEEPQADTNTMGTLPALPPTPAVNRAEASIPMPALSAAAAEAAASVAELPSVPSALVSDLRRADVCPVPTLEQVATSAREPAQEATFAPAAPILPRAIAAETPRATLPTLPTPTVPSDRVDASAALDRVLAAAAASEHAAIDSHLRLPIAPPAPVLTEAAAPEPIDSFAQRAPDARAEVLVATGGNDETEAAVSRALAYFERHQSSDGRWSAMNFAGAVTSLHDATCDCGAPAEVSMDVATTGMVLLCYLGAGHAHVEAGPFHDAVQRGLAWLVAGQATDGDLRRRGTGGADSLYGHTIATVALCEAYAMTRDAALAEPVRRAHAFLERRSTARRGGTVAPQDTSVLGWEVMALASARRAGLAVRPDAAQAVREWLDGVSLRGASGRYAYRPGDPPSVAMTAEALFVQQLLDELDGRDSDERREAQSAAFVLEALPRADDNTLSHHWYYATLALHRRQGDAWRQWNEALAPLLVERQRRDGCGEGSWDPRDPWSKLGGRLYQTAVCTLSLEVYYRYRVAGTSGGR